MKTLHLAVASALLLVALTGCNLPVSQPTPNPNDVGTQVGKLLTITPEETTLPTAIVTETIVVPTIFPTEAPTATQEPTVTVEPTEAATATSITASATPAASTTAVVDDPKTKLGTPTRADTLDTAQYWGTFSDEHVKVEEQSGYLQLTALNPDGWHGWTLSFPKLIDFYMEVTAKPGSCEGKDSYGMLVRAPDPTQGYFYGFSCDGRYIFQKWDGKAFTNLVNWTANSAIVSGSNQTNRLGLMAKGSDFTLYANGVKIGSASDTSYPEGIFGLYIAAYKTAGFNVQVDEVDYWNLQ